MKPVISSATMAVPDSVPLWKLHGVIGALNDPCRKTRIEACRYLTRLIPESSTVSDINLPPLTRSPAVLLTEKNYHTRKLVVKTIARLGKYATPFKHDIMFYLDHNDSRIRESAAEALAVIALSDKNSVREIVDTLHKSRVNHRIVSRVKHSMKDVLEKAAPYIARRLNSKDQDTVLDALYTLGDLGPAAEPYLPRFVTFLKGYHRNYRRASAIALGKIGKAAAPYAPLLLAYYKDEKEYSAYVYLTPALDALDSLAEFIPEMAPDIAPLLHDSSNPGVRSSAAYILGKMGEAAQPFTDDLLALLNDDHTDVAKAAEDALISLTAALRRIPLTFVDLLTADQPDVRSAICRILKSTPYHTKESTAAIAALLKDDFQLNRKEAISVLGSTGEFGKPYVPAIVTFLDDAYPPVRWAAVSALGNLGIHAKASIPECIVLSGNERSSVRSAAISTLGKIGHFSKQVRAVFASLLNDPSPSVRRSSLEALALHPEQTAIFKKDILHFLEDDDGNIRELAATIAGDLGNRGHLVPSEVITYLRGKKYYTIRSATAALRSMNKHQNEVLEKVAILLTDSSSTTILAACSLLIHGGSASTPYIEQLLTLINHKEFRVRMTAIAALGSIGAATRPHIPLLIDLITKPKINYGNGIATREALVNIGPADRASILRLLSAIHWHKGARDQYRFAAHMLAGSDRELHHLMTFIGAPCVKIPAFTSSGGNKVLKQLFRVWNECDTLGLDSLRLETSAVIEHYAEYPIISPADLLVFLAAPASLLKECGPFTRKRIRTSRIGLISSIVIIPLLLHLLFWLTLFVFYPWSPSIQKNFFWNTRVRSRAGLGYIGFFLFHIPSFRKRLFTPFRKVLIADAQLEQYSKHYFYRNLILKNEQTGTFLHINKIILKPRGIMLITGGAGTGKTLFMRKVLKRSGRLSVFLSALNCHNGIIAAIEEKLPVWMHDSGFLRKCIEKGTFDLFIDSLEKLPEKSSTALSEFIENRFKGNCLFSSRSSWKPSATTATFTLFPLDKKRIERFLLLMHNNDIYKQKVSSWLEDYLPEETISSEQKRIFGYLSLPENLIRIGKELSSGGMPHIPADP